MALRSSGIIFNDNRLYNTHNNDLSCGARNKGLETFQVTIKIRLCNYESNSRYVTIKVKISRRF